jgi:energy-coupling factor transporter transmembrane protein EcfT
VFICLIVIFAKDSNSSDVENQRWKEYREREHNRDNGWMKISHLWIFVISFLFGVLVVFWLKDVVLYLRILLWIVWAFFVFIAGGLLFNYKSLRVWEWKFYLVLLVLALIRSIIKLVGIDFPVFESESENNIEQIVWNNDFVDENEVIWEEIVVDINENSESIQNWVWLEENSNENLWEINEELDDNTLATFTDVIKFLLKNEKLSTKTDLTFSYIWKSNPDYAYYKTAYEKKMIWKDLQPTKNLMCETYVVMKWLVEWWSVWTYNDIKQTYWNYAKNNGLLPDCQYGKYVKISDLK